MEEENIDTQNPEDKIVEKPYLTYEKVVSGLSDRAKQYHDVKIRKVVFTKIFSIVVLFLLVILRVPNYIRDISPFGQDYGFMSLLFVFVVFQTISQLIDLPISIYDEKVEREYEFSTRTNKKFVKDQIKGFLLTLVIMGLMVEAIFSALYFVPEIWWFYGFLGYFLFAGVLQTLSPLLISLFTKIERLPDGEVRTTVEQLARDMDLSFKDIYLWKLSDQTSKANAAVVGFGKSIKIILGDTLIDNFRVDEVEVVMAHEIAHQKNRDIYRGTLYMGVVMLIAFWLIDQVFNQALIWFDLSAKSDPAALGFFMLGLSVVFEFTNIFTLALTRRQEKAADVTAIKKLQNLEVYESAFARLGQQNLSYPNPSRLEVLFLYSHPPIRDRVAYAKQYVS